MLTHHHTQDEPTPQQDSSVETEVNKPVDDNKDVISFKLNRQTLVVSALAILLVISVLETIELTRLHQALRTWQTLSPAVASATATTPVSASGGSTLPNQVGGC